MTEWLTEMFPVRKPVIGMLHLSALPGDPGYDTQAGLSAVVDRAKTELDALRNSRFYKVATSLRNMRLRVRRLIASADGARFDH